jgi:hypothetical protein
MAQRTDLPMETLMIQPASRTASIKTCVHSRLIDEVLTKSGKRTGKVHCVECGAKFDDPSRGLK